MAQVWESSDLGVISSNVFQLFFTFSVTQYCFQDTLSASNFVCETLVNKMAFDSFKPYS